MKIAIIGTENSLKTPLAVSVGHAIGNSYLETSVRAVMDKMKMKSFKDCGPTEAFQLIDLVMQNHSEKVTKSHSGVFGISSIECLAYYLYYCSATEPVDQSRNVIKNLINFVINYDHIFVVPFNKDTFDHDAQDRIFGGNLAFEYMLDYLMHGILDKFAIRHTVLTEKDIETLTSELIGKLPF